MFARLFSPLSRQWVDHIPVSWMAPRGREPFGLAIWLPCFGSCKEDVQPELEQLSADGFVALSFDPWQHGERRQEPVRRLQQRVFGNFQRHMWPILAHTTEDCLRVIDWGLERFGLAPRVVMGGLSLGGDIAVAASGLDRRITTVAVMLATPDWSRPGMDLSPGRPDCYAQHLFDRLNPMMHLDRYSHCPAITFECGERDTHVPPNGPLAFQSALEATYSTHRDRLRVVLHPEIGHQGTDVMWQRCRAWFRRQTVVGEPLKA